MPDVSANPSDNPLSPGAALQEAVARESSFRLAAVREILALEDRIAAQASELARRDTYVHELHQARTAGDFAVAQAHADFAFLAGRLAAAEDEVARLKGLRSTLSWKITAPVRAIERALRSSPGPKAEPTAPAAFDYHLVTSPFRIFGPEPFCLEGWVTRRDRQPLEEIRARLGDREFAGRWIDDVTHPAVTEASSADRKHFLVEISVQPGRHFLRLEARSGQHEWESILATPVWRAR